MENQYTLAKEMAKYDETLVGMILYETVKSSAGENWNENGKPMMAFQGVTVFESTEDKTHIGMTFLPKDSEIISVRPMEHNLKKNFVLYKNTELKAEEFDGNPGDMIIDVVEADLNNFYYTENFIGYV